MSEVYMAYDAFISYRHTEKDRYVAEQVHKRLESFRLPGNVRKKKGKEHKTRITRIFRDKDELPLTSNLAEPITEALAASEFLIVICSPRIRESVWCRTEIDTFIRMHGQDHILAVLIEGEPEEAFPEELLYREEEEKDSHGGTVIKKIPIEPLAADLRGNSRREVRKKMKTEILRLAAPIFGCGYDDLRQRHRERRLKRIAGAAFLGSALCLTVGAVSTAMALRINRQKEQLKVQSEEIRRQSEELQERYTEALRTNSVIQADTALELLQSGDRMAAADLAVQALPPSEGASDIPWTPQAQYALTEALYSYENGARILPQHILRHDTEIDAVKISPGGKRVLTVERSGALTVWDAVRGERLYRAEAEPYTVRMEDNTLFLTDDRILYATEEGYAVYDLLSGETVYTGAHEGGGLLVCAAVDAVGRRFAVSDGDRVRVCRTEDGTELFAFADETEREISGAGCFSEDGGLYAVGVAKTFGQTEREEAVGNEALVFDTATGELLHKYRLPWRRIGQMSFARDRLYVINNRDDDEREEDASGPLFGTGEGRLYACDLNSYDEIHWSYSHPEGWLYDMVYAENGNEGRLLCIFYDGVDLLEAKEGGLLTAFNYGTRVVSLTPTDNEELFFLFTGDGEFHYLNAPKRMDMVYEGRFRSGSDHVKEFLFGDGIYILLPYGDTGVTVSAKTLGGRMEKLLTLDSDVHMARINKTGTRLLVLKFGEEVGQEWVSLYDAERLKLIKSFPVPDSVKYPEGIEFSGDAEEYFRVDGEKASAWYDAMTGEPVREEERDEEAVKKRFGAQDCGLMCITAAGETYFAAADPEEGTLSLYQSGKKEKKIPINAGYISALFFDGEEKRLFVTFADGKIEVYDTNDLSIICNFTETEEIMTGGVFDAAAGYDILYGDSDAYVVNEEMKVIAHLMGFQDVDSGSGYFYISHINTIYRVPVHDLKMLEVDYEKLKSR